MRNILSNWDELAAYLSFVLSICDANHRHKIRQLMTILRDPQNKLYFIFVLPIQ